MLESPNTDTQVRKSSSTLDEVLSIALPTSSESTLGADEEYAYLNHSSSSVAEDEIDIQNSTFCHRPRDMLRSWYYLHTQITEFSFEEATV